VLVGNAETGRVETGQVQAISRFTFPILWAWGVLYVVSLREDSGTVLRHPCHIAIGVPVEVFMSTDTSISDERVGVEAFFLPSTNGFEFEASLIMACTSSRIRFSAANNKQLPLNPDCLNSWQQVSAPGRFSLADDMRRAAQPCGVVGGTRPTPPRISAPPRLSVAPIFNHRDLRDNSRFPACAATTKL
jgi:hypothetical protein